MDIHSQLEDLTDLAEKLNVKIETHDLSDNEFSPRSGYCKLYGKDLIVFDNNLPPEGKVEILLNALEKFDLETIYVSPWIREQLSKRKAN